MLPSATTTESATATPHETAASASGATQTRPTQTQSVIAETLGGPRDKKLNMIYRIIEVWTILFRPLGLEFIHRSSLYIWISQNLGHLLDQEMNPAAVAG